MEGVAYVYPLTSSGPLTPIRQNTMETVYNPLRHFHFFDNRAQDDMDHQTWAIEGPHGAMGCDVRGVVVIVGLEKQGPVTRC